MTSPLLDAALTYIGLGWPVFPCKAGAKEPATRHGLKDASLDRAQIEAWFAQGDLNLAMATGAPAPEVLDIDGPAGEARLEAWIAEHGPLPPGPVGITGRPDGGRHLFFAPGTLWPRNRHNPGQGIDVRSTGGYVVMAPSIHPSGKTYEIQDLDEPLPAAPAWLVAELEKLALAMPEVALGPPIAVGEDLELALLEMMPRPLDWGAVLRTIPEGSRNDTLYRWASKLRGEGWELPKLFECMERANRRLCQPPLPVSDVEKLSRSAMRHTPNAELRKAREKAEEQTQEAAEGDVLDQQSQDPRIEPEVRLQALEQALGIVVLRVVLWGRDPAAYHLHLRRDRTDYLVEIGENLLARDRIRTLVLNETGHLIEVPAKRWPAVARMIRAVAEEEDPGIEGRRGVTEEALDAWSLADPPEVATTEAERTELWREGARHFVSEEDGERLRWVLATPFNLQLAALGVRESPSDTGRRLRRAGFRARRSSVRVEGRPESIRYWVREEPKSRGS